MTRTNARKTLFAITLAAALLLGVKAAWAFTGAPTLSIPIPGIKLSDIPVQEGVSSGTVDIPWIEEYIAGIYRYAISIGTFLAGVMVVIGGFQYLTAGAEAPKIQAAKQRMSDAIIGLILLLGSNAIFAAVSPELLTLSSLRVQLVGKQILAQDQHTLETTKTPTAEAPVGTGGEAPSAQPPKFENCPVQLTQEGNWAPGFKKVLNKGHSPQLTKDPRRNEFIEKIKPFITGPTQADKLQQVAEATVKCGISFGSCGGTAGAIYALAGVGDPSCLNSNGECRNHEKAKIVMGIPSASVLRKVLCSYKDSCCKQYKDCKIDNSGCTDDRSTAIQNVAKMMAQKYPGYPDSWANLLKPGDIIWVFNANSDCGGQHSAMFMGWGADGRANVIQGMWAANAWKGSICVKSNCGGNQQAITQVFRAP